MGRRMLVFAEIGYDTTTVRNGRRSETSSYCHDFHPIARSGGLNSIPHAVSEARLPLNVCPASVMRLGQARDPSERRISRGFTLHVILTPATH